MSYTSVTYTFTNGTTADANEANANFTDIINGLSDGTKDLNMNNGAFSGTLSCNGAATLGNGTGDDITISGSLAATLNIKTTHSYDFGSSTIGIRDIYFGSSAGAFTTKLSGADVAASKTVVLPGFDFTFPISDGVVGAALVTNGSGVGSFQDIGGPSFASNYSITASVASNALTIGLTGSGGTALSATNKAQFAFRNATITTGQYSVISATSDLSLVISNTSSLGHISGALCNIYIYAINDAGTISIGVCSQKLDESVVHTSVAEGGAGAADSDSILYSTNAHVACAIKCIGLLKSNQATAGVWASAISNIYCGLKENSDINFESSDYTITDKDNAKIWMITTGSAANVTITLPDCASNHGKIIEIIKADSGTKFVAIARAGSDTIRGSATSIYAIQQHESIKLLANATNWVLLGEPLRTVSGYIAANGSISRQIGNWITSSSEDSTGIYYVNWATGPFLTPETNYAVVSIHSVTGTMTHFAGIYDINSTRVIVHTRSDAGALASKAFIITVTGLK